MNLLRKDNFFRGYINLLNFPVTIGWIMALTCIGLFFYLFYITDLYSNYKDHKKVDKDSKLDYGYASYDDFLRIITTKEKILRIEKLAWWENIVSINKKEDIYLQESGIKIDSKLMFMETFSDYKKYRKHYYKLLEQLREKEENEIQKRIKEKNNVDWSSFNDE